MDKVLSVKEANKRLEELRTQTRREYEAKVAERGGEVMHFSLDTPKIGLYSEDRARYEEAGATSYRIETYEPELEAQPHHDFDDTWQPSSRQQTKPRRSR